MTKTQKILYGVRHSLELRLLTLLLAISSGSMTFFKEAISLPFLPIQILIMMVFLLCARVEALRSGTIYDALQRQHEDILSTSGKKSWIVRNTYPLLWILKFSDKYLPRFFSVLRLCIVFLMLTIAFFVVMPLQIILGTFVFAYKDARKKALRFNQYENTDLSQKITMASVYLAEGRSVKFDYHYYKKIFRFLHYPGRDQLTCYKLVEYLLRDNGQSKVSNINIEELHKMYNELQEKFYVYRAKEEIGRCPITQDSLDGVPSVLPSSTWSLLNSTGGVDLFDRGIPFCPLSRAGIISEEILPVNSVSFNDETLTLPKYDCITGKPFQFGTDFYLVLQHNQWHLTQQKPTTGSMCRDKLPGNHVFVVAYNNILGMSADTTAGCSLPAIPCSGNSFFDAPGGTSQEESGCEDLQKKYG